MWRQGRWLLAIWGLVLFAYSNSFQAALVFDNAAVIGEDPRIREATPQNVASIVTGRYWYGNDASAATAGLYRPFTTFSYLLNYAVLGNGPRPSGYHGVNLALHEINVALVYALGLLIFAETAPAVALAAIWGLHPLLTVSVTNIVGRADLLAAFGVLAGLLCHARGASAKGQRRVAWLAGLAAAQATLRIDPDFAGAHVNLANVLAQMPGRLSDAIAEYQAALRIRPDLASVHYNLANALAMSDRLPEAIAEYRAALRIDPDFVEAHISLGNALEQTARLPEAIAEYEAALRIRPDPELRRTWTDYGRVGTKRD